MKALHICMLAAAMTALAACSDDNNEPQLPPVQDRPTVSEGAFVLNQGSYYSLIEGSLTSIDFSTKKAAQNVFANANGRSLGATPQAGVVYGEKIYIGVYESNVIEVLDRTSCISLKQISLSGAEGQGPRSLVAKDGKVYVSMYNGYVSRLDTLSLSIDKTVKVGPNPEEMAIRGNYLYVPNSDGLNYEAGYGTTASKIDLSTFTVAKTFEVGLNPYTFASNGTDLFLLCKGNYYDIPSTIYRIADDDSSTPLAEATLMSIRDSKLYYIDAPFGASELKYKVYDIASGTTADMLKDNGVDSPAGIGVDPVNGTIVVTSYTMDGPYASYNTDGYAKIYDKDGNLQFSCPTGVGPCAVFFNYR